MNSKTTSEKLIQFIENSPSAFHTVETIKFLLLKNNFSELCENKHWHITAGGNYFVTRNNSSLIAFFHSRKSTCRNAYYRKPQ